MIKNLKHLLSILLISFVILFGNYSKASVNGYYDTIGGITSSYDNGYFMSVSYNGVLNTTYLGVSKHLLMYSEGNYFLWDENSKPYIGYKGGTVGQGYPTDFLLCDSLNSSAPSNCTRYDYSTNSGTVGSVLSSLNSVYYGKFTQSNEIGENVKGSLFCFSNTSYNKSVCFYGCSHPNCGSSSSDKIGGAYLIRNLSNSQNFSTNLADIPSNRLGFPPDYVPGIVDGNSGLLINTGIELNSTESALNYFENYYGWDEKVCYVGIDNVTDLWGSSVSFEEGTGLNIFDTFELLYGNTELKRMYVWMNSWLINYNQWFQDPEDRLYLANYNSGTNQVDLYYDNLTFPFANQPVALYFMADNISNYTYRQTMASDVVSYCYIKLKGGTYDDIIDNSTKQSIYQYTEKSNTNKGLNPDGTIRNIDYSSFGSYGDLTGDNSLKSVFGEFFANNDFFKNLNVNSTYKVLPDWLVVSFIFVVVFKLFRRKK